MSQHLPQTPAPKIEDARVAILAAEWNGHINEQMVAQAQEYFDANGVEYATYHVPGAVELTFGASQLIEASEFDAVIVFGTVIRGGTPHFDYVCMSVTQGITALNADCDIPVIFGVLTVDREQDALDRVSKGRECAEAAVKMIAFKRSI
ncbi:MAG: 6,7-dimethyl-8-ribityllumazine synthase [Bacteroidales bacterium]|nr:6,7-dimethyl-8-ribityllumazine synthase [Bacteroidales bacterium]